MRGHCIIPLGSFTAAPTLLADRILCLCNIAQLAGRGKPRGTPGHDSPREPFDHLHNTPGLRRHIQPPPSPTILLATISPEAGRSEATRHRLTYAEPATLCTIDKPAEGEQDCPAPIPGSPSDEYLPEDVMQRISILVLTLSAAFASVAWGQQLVGKCTNNWTEFHRPNMVRWNPCERVLNVNNVGSLGLKWSYTTGLEVYSSPAVTNGVVYVGSDDNHVYALSASSGAKLWSYATGYIVYSSPAVANGVVYVGSGDSNLYALNAKTGAKLWNDVTGNDVLSPPAVVNGVVYVGSNDGNVYALSASTGAKLWSYKIGGLVRSSPAVANGVVYVGSDYVYALNAKTGAKLWSYYTGSYGMWSSPAVADGVVYFGTDNNHLYALDASTGAKLWSYKTGAFVNSSPAVANGVVYVGSADHNVYALNAKTGAKLWSYTTGYGVYSSPAVANGVVYVGSEDGTVYAFGLP
jgi:outer membrane protein assembly factor BamB